MEQKNATRAKHQRNRLAIVITILLAVAVLFGAGTGTYMWSQTRYYVGNSNGKVAIYQGVPTNLFGLALSHEVSSTSITVSNLPQTWHDQLNRGISVGSLDEAQSHVGIIRSEMNKFKKQQESEQAKKSTSSNSSGSSNSSTSGNTNKSESGIGAADDATTGGSQ